MTEGIERERVERLLRQLQDEYDRDELFETTFSDRIVELLCDVSTDDYDLARCLNWKGMETLTRHASQLSEADLTGGMVWSVDSSATVHVRNGLIPSFLTLMEQWKGKGWVVATVDPSKGYTIWSSDSLFDSGKSSDAD